eukprot:368099_1
MGNGFSCDGPVQVEKDFESTEATGVLAAAEEKALEATIAVEDAVASVVHQVSDTADKVESVVVADATATKETTETVAQTVATVMDAAKEAAENTADAVKDMAKDAGEVVNATMDAAAAAVSGTMVVRFVDEKGVSQRVDFKTQAFGFTTGLSGGGCCVRKTKAKVVVKKVEKGGQAAALGVKTGWTVFSIDGVEITGVDQSRQLVTSCCAKLPKE